MENARGWTDKDVSIPREEWGSVEAVPTNQAPGYVSMEERYNEGFRESGSSNTDEKARGWTDKDVSIPREEWGSVEAAPANQAPGYVSMEEKYNEGFKEKGGPSINGTSINDLIINGLLTPDNIKPEQQEIVYEDIMLGFTNNKNLLAKKLDLIIERKDLINKIVYNQYNLAVKEIMHDKRGFVSHTPENRKFQFLTTVMMLMQKGYDIDSLKFDVIGIEINLHRLLSSFKRECTSGVKSIEDPSWFVDGQMPEGYDTRKVNNPWLFTGVLISDIYSKKPNLFEEEYQKYLATTRMPVEMQMSYEEFMFNTYGVNVEEKRKEQDNTEGMHM